ncbi:hypothetical protein ACJ73_01527 [Blastomyces percursus]|uniref:Amidase domain-containing protein n=1 Tax=Blastomyces percursus TaxID=1658174 RepID=A0A1J9RES9_9EURO|nr:hypothetical protein ACJ73_01527 [Blastomyces percursus]
MSNLSNSSIRDLLLGLEERKFTSVDLVKAYLARINQVNEVVKAINAVNSDAIDIAEKYDSERASGNLRGRLHGIPILVKDVFLTTDGMDTTSGCSGLIGARPKFEATVIKKLHSAGAIILGKTNCSEWANFRAPEKSISGWSAVGGQGLGIYAKNQSPAGSSSGSAVATALGLAAAALGTETTGSISSPARVSGIVGLKPTVGLTSRYGAYCVTEWEDSVGVLGRTVVDAATVLTAIAGIDRLDNFTSADPRDDGHNIRPAEGTDFSESCGPDGLRGLRIGIPRHCFQLDETVMAQFDEALKVMEKHGATIVDNLEFSQWSPKYPDIERAEWRLSFRKELRENMAKFLESFDVNPCELHTLADVMEYTKKTPEELFARYGMKQWGQAEDIGKRFDFDSEEYKKSRSRRLFIGRQIPELLDTHKCDVLVAPSWVDTTANYGGCPTISVPMGFYPSDFPSIYTPDNLLVTGPNIPNAILFVGRRWDDQRLIAAAHSYEQATHHRDSFRPVIEATVELGTSARSVSPLILETDRVERKDRPYLIEESNSILTCKNTITPAIVNYLAPDEKWLTVKPYQIVGTLPAGLPRQNIELKAYPMNINDVRAEDLGRFSLDKEGFQWISHCAEESLDTETSIDKYIQQMEDFVKTYLKANAVRTYQYQLRKVGGDPNNRDIRPASNMIHIGMPTTLGQHKQKVINSIDMTPMASRNRAIRIFQEKGAKVLDGRVRLLSVWRPLFGPIKDYPLAVCDSETVVKGDLIESDHIYPDFESETYCVLHNTDHRWYYLSDQTKDEVLLITNYDSQTHRRVPHTGFQMPSSNGVTRARESLELKVVVIG